MWLSASTYFPMDATQSVMPWLLALGPLSFNMQLSSTHGSLHLTYAEGCHPQSGGCGAQSVADVHGHSPHKGERDE